MKKIAVVGSVNMDLQYSVKDKYHFGETGFAESSEFLPGGKGLNQATACHLLGGDVTFFGQIGHDAFGDLLQEHIRDIGLKHFLHVNQNTATGMALVESYKSENRIIVLSGSNMQYTEKLQKTLMEQLIDFDIILFQNEIAQELNLTLIPFLSQNKKTIIYDPAPAIHIPAELLQYIDYILPNQYEYQTVLQTDDDVDEALLRAAPNHLLITLGADGTKYFDGKHIVHVPALHNLQVIDTTGAGDTFAGSLTYALACSYSLKEAVRFANVAAGLSTTGMGAQTAMPHLDQVIQALQSEK